MECVDNLIIDTARCKKPCSGLIVTSFSKTVENGKLDKLLNVLEDYKSYKTVTPFPPGKSGK